MTEVIIKFASPIKCDFCRFTFNNSRALDQHVKGEHESLIEPATSGANSAPKKEVNLKYVLNEIKNLKVAKSNAKKSLVVVRDEINDVNIK